MHVSILFVCILLLSDAALAVEPSQAMPRFVFERKLLPSSSPESFPLAADLFKLHKKQLSFAIQIKAGALEKDGTLMVLVDRAGAEAMRLEVVLQPATRGEKGRKLQLLLSTDFRAQPLSVGVPVRLLNVAAAHEVIVRYFGFGLDFFVDGVLVDQEWPIGMVAAAGTERLDMGPNIGKITFWNGLLPDGEVARMSGGAERVAQRADRMLGPESSQLQYWQPRGYNTSAGDAMPFFHDGILHVFFLLDRRHHQSKWGLGAHQWGHFSTTDLVHWKSYPAALTIDEEGEASICTGSIFFEHGKYFAFYATRQQDRSERLGMAESPDGITFTKVLPTPFAEPELPFQLGPNRDPFVFGHDHDFHMTVTATLAQPPSPNEAGVLEHLTSTDLRHWKVEPAPFFTTGYASDPECSDVFLWRGWYYLLFSEGGIAHYRMSREQFGPWTTPAVDVLDGMEARVMKTAAFTGDRRIGVAFLADGEFGGQLIFRELLQATDGTLRTTFPSEMVSHGAEIPLHAQPKVGVVKQDKDRILLGTEEHAARTRIEGVSDDFTLKAKWTPHTPGARFGIELGGGGEGAPEGDARLLIDPAAGRVGWTLASGAPDSRSIEDDDLHGPVTLHVVAKGTVVDVDVNGTHTLVHRLPRWTTRSLELFTEGGEIVIENMHIEQLSRTQAPPRMAK